MIVHAAETLPHGCHDRLNGSAKLILKMMPMRHVTDFHVRLPASYPALCLGHKWILFTGILVGLLNLMRAPHGCLLVCRARSQASQQCHSPQRICNALKGQSSWSQIFLEQCTSQRACCQGRPAAVESATGHVQKGQWVFDDSVVLCSSFYARD